MTAPRMTDERFAAMAEHMTSASGEYASTRALVEEARRARASESAALARVRRLEEVVRRLMEAMAPDVPDRVWHSAFDAARAALSEET